MVGSKSFDKQGQMRLRVENIIGRQQVDLANGFGQVFGCDPFYDNRDQPFARALNLAKFPFDPARRNRA